jgi:hypothetical protein
MKRLATLLLLIGSTSVLAGADESPEHATAPSHEAAVDTAPHPRLSSDPKWAGRVVAGIAVLFIAAIPIGLLYRAVAPAAGPEPDHHDDHSHDAADHGGGHGGHH